MEPSNWTATRVGRDASQVADEVIAHLSGLMGAKVTVTLEIEAEVPSGAPDNVVRTVTGEQPDIKIHEPGVREGVGPGQDERWSEM